MCFYHRVDLDGVCSGAIVKRRFEDCEMVGINYGDEYDFNSIPDNTTIYVVDFSFDRDVMEDLNKRCELIWLDHHKSAIEKCDGLGYIKGARKIDKAGCELTWEYLYPHNTPTAVRYLGLYDTWRWVKNPDSEEILQFQYGMRALNLSVDSSDWDYYFRGIMEMRPVIDNGKAILEYQQQQYANQVKNWSYEVKFEGYRAIVMNAHGNSQLFDSVWDENKYDIMLLYRFNGKKNVVSIYTTKDIDCSLIAQKFGGGGHAKACGFQCDTIPWGK